MSAVRLRRDDRGQSLVEFALTVPVLILLIVGMVQLGIAYWNYMQLTDAVRVGGRAAATQTTQAAACTQGKSAAATNWSTPTYGCQAATIAGATGSDLAETISGQTPFSINILGIVVYSGQLTSSTTERLS
jgi:Flp pilus assembly protein TadG